MHTYTVIGGERTEQEAHERDFFLFLSLKQNTKRKKNQQLQKKKKNNNDNNRRHKFQYVCTTESEKVDELNVVYVGNDGSIV